MSVVRLMGIETEYAIASESSNNPIALSYELVEAAASAAPAPVRWDYRSEDPVNDARGYHLPRASARPDMLTDSPELRTTNVVAGNGGRIYVDHAHPEYSSPEVKSPRQVIAYDRAGDLLMQEAAENASRTTGHRISIYRNNTDGKGSSWGAHESYQMRRSVDFMTVASLMELHFVTRQIYTGAGRVGLGEGTERGEVTPGYQLSQRADYFHARIGLQTTFDRPIVNTRDESHSTAEFRRLHVIVGDANRMDVPEFLKMGVTSLVIWLAENAETAGFDLNSFVAGHALKDPVSALQGISHDFTLGAEWDTESGAKTTAWQTQVALRSAIYEVAAAVFGTDSTGEPLWPDAPTREVVQIWGEVLALLARVHHESDEERLSDTDAASNLEWLLKWQILEGLRRRKKTQWDAPLLKAVDLRWADCNPAVSVFTKLRSRTRRLVSDEDILAARRAPENTRAWLRAQMIREFPSDIAAAAWKQIAVRTQDGDIATLDMSDSERFTREKVSDALDEASTAMEVLRLLSGKQ